jgi:hypothetical protein
MSEKKQLGKKNLTKQTQINRSVENRKKQKGNRKWIFVRYSPLKFKFIQILKFYNMKA